MGNVGRIWFVVAAAVVVGQGCFVDPGAIDNGHAGESGDTAAMADDTGAPATDDGTDGAADSTGAAVGSDDASDSSGSDSGDGSTGAPLDCGECLDDDGDPCTFPACIEGQCILEDHGIVVYGFGDGLAPPAREVYGLDPASPPAAAYGPAVPLFRMLDTADVPETSPIYEVYETHKPDWFLTLTQGEGADIGYEQMGDALGYAWSPDVEPPAGTLPLYRYYRIDTQTHVHSLEQSLSADPSFQYEGPTLFACPATPPQ